MLKCCNIVVSLYSAIELELLVVNSACDSVFLWSMDVFLYWLWFRNLTIWNTAEVIDMCGWFHLINHMSELYPDMLYCYLCWSNHELYSILGYKSECCVWLKVWMKCILSERNVLCSHCKSCCVILLIE